MGIGGRARGAVCSESHCVLCCTLHVSSDEIARPLVHPSLCPHNHAPIQAPRNASFTPSQCMGQRTC
eukprot:91095-Chlamydomonas_euryale.AAC.2